MSLRAALVSFLVSVSLPCASHGLGSEVQANSSTHLRGHHRIHRHTAAARNSTTSATARATTVKAVGQHPPHHHKRTLSSLAKESVVKHKIAVNGPSPPLRVSELSNESAPGLPGAGAGQEDATGTIEVNGPLPPDFQERFTQAVAKAAKIPTSKVHVLDSHPYEGSDGPAGLYEIKFSAPEGAVSSILDQAANPDSDLANSPLHWFLLEKDEGTEEAPEIEVASPAQPDEPVAVTAPSGGLDIDTEMPFGELAPFGREDTAKELTEQSVAESDGMVDQLERAEVAEEKRAVFRALTRLRGAAVTSFDGIARSQTGNIDQYNAVNKWRATHPVQHLAQEESDISAWAFPSQSD